MIIEDDNGFDDSQKVLVIHVPLEQYKWLSKQSRKLDIRMSLIVQHAIDILRQELELEVVIDTSSDML